VPGDLFIRAASGPGTNYEQFLVTQQFRIQAYEVPKATDKDFFCVLERSLLDLQTLITSDLPTLLVRKQTEPLYCVERPMSFHHFHNKNLKFPSSSSDFEFKSLYLKASTLLYLSVIIYLCRK
jgi:hypothetical protein